jgi:hypothetical protein
MSTDKLPALPPKSDAQFAKDIPLMPCPHCGGVADLDPGTHPQRSWVDCGGECGLSGPSLYSALDAVNAWNDLARKVSKVAELEREIREAWEVLNAQRFFPTKKLRSRTERFLKRDSVKENGQ